VLSNEIDNMALIMPSQTKSTNVAQADPGSTSSKKSAGRSM